MSSNHFSAQQQARAVAALADLGLRGIKNADGTVSCMGMIDLRYKNLLTLPDLTAVRLRGDFYCSNNQLGSLRGAPHAIEGRFHCTSNNLVSLQGGPVYVGRDYDCSGNALENLDHLPRQSKPHVKSDFGSFTSPDVVPASLTPSLREERARAEALKKEERQRDFNAKKQKALAGLHTGAKASKFKL